MNSFQEIFAASCSMDWGQVVANGGPPCFHVQENGTFCGRAERWFGHKPVYRSKAADHDFVPLHVLISKIKKIGWREGMENAIKVIEPHNPHANSPNTSTRCKCMSEIRESINDGTEARGN